VFNVFLQFPFLFLVIAGILQFSDSIRSKFYRFSQIRINSVSGQVKDSLPSGAVGINAWS
jgi:hypothetical protein